jgi:predicted nuclease of predicted toxin-antitoxin system
VNLLLDENLSPACFHRSPRSFRGSSHVRDIGLKQALDESIWDWARTNGYTVDHY